MRQSGRIDQPAWPAVAGPAARAMCWSSACCSTGPITPTSALAYSSVELWKGERTPIGAYLLIHGPHCSSWLLPSGPGVGRSLRHVMAARALRLWLTSGGRRARCQHLYRRCWCAARPWAMSWLDGAGRSLWSCYWPVLCSRPGSCCSSCLCWLLAAALTFAAPRHAGAAFRHAARRPGLVLTLAVEYIVLKGDIGRMNTVFKFYLQVWILWGIAAAVALGLPAARARSPGGVAIAACGVRCWRC